MFIGHFALGLAAKKADRGPSLGTYFLAAQLADVLWPGLLLAGVEHVTIAPGDTAFTPLRFDSYPLSHSLLTLALLGAAFGALHWARKLDGRAALLLGLLVPSHWVLDFATHRPDMPLVYLGNVFGPPPPSVAAIAWAGLPGAALILAWAVWVDRHRSPAQGRSAPA